MSWLILKDGNFVLLGRGVNTAGTGSRLSTYGTSVTLAPATPTDSYVVFDKWVIVSSEVKATYKSVESFGDIRNLVRFDELGTGAPVVSDVFALFYAKGGELTLNTINTYLLQNK